jgi:tetratricopeptide (TPR) repeat protein
MNTCDNIYEKILFFDDLSAEEQEEIRKHAEHCAGCRQKLTEFQSITVSLQHHQAEHTVDDELLERYSVYLEAMNEPDYDGRRLTAAEIGEIREHLAKCPGCREEVERLRQENRSLRTYLENTDLAGLSLAAGKPEPSFLEKIENVLRNVGETIRDKISFSSPAFYPIAAGAIAGLLLLFWFGPFFRGDDYQYYRLASLEQEKFSPVTRSNVPEILSKGLSAFHEQHYQQAIGELERYIAENPGDPNLFSAHYFAGLAYLTESKSDFLGRFEKYDSNRLEKGIQHLQTAEKLTDNLGLKEDCYWYLGKAYLMQKDGKRATEMFQKVIDLQGRRIREAQEIVREIEEVKSET